VVTGESLDQPQTLALDPTRRIFVQVNDRRRPSGEYEDNSGGFNLAVRVMVA
jgi:hypothetical protein